MMSRKSSSAILPGGLWIEGRRHQEAGLRPVSGRDEAFLAEMTGKFTSAQCTTALLARCLTRLGPARRIRKIEAASLAVGDREALLLQLRRITLGEHIQCVVHCPGPDCAKKMDVELRVSQLLLPPYSEWPEHAETTVRHNGVGHRVRFRLPTGADQEATAPLAGTDPREAADLLLRRCIESMKCEVNGASSELPSDRLDQSLSRLMREMDPQAELVLSTNCPECSLRFSFHFDTASFFLKELEAFNRQLYRQVHILAFHYHWSERAILSMPASKRSRYLELLAEGLTEDKQR